MPDNGEPGGDKAVARTIAVIALILLSTVALRGHLPGADPRSEPDEPATGGTGSLVAVGVMLAVSIIVIAISVFSQGRRRQVRSGQHDYRRERGRDAGRRRWRPLLIAAAVLLAWALLLALLMRWMPAVDVGEPPAPEPPQDIADPAGAGTPPPQEPADSGGTVFGVLAAMTIALIALSVVATIVGRRRTSDPPSAAFDDQALPAQVSGPDLARAAELGLAEMGDLSRDPRAAIIACYLAMERELEKSPGTVPQDSDTPSEVLARAIEHRALPAASATVLVDLFEEARFSPHVMHEGHRADAMGALQSVQRELQAST